GRQVLVGLARAATAPPVTHEQSHLPWLTLGVGTGALPTTPEPIVPIVTTAGPAGPTGARAVQIAERYLGIPYVWGGADPAIGFDCSGLVMYVYRQLGIDLLHFIGAQYHEGAPVPSVALAPGDLVFFDPVPLGPGHAGMYA